MDWQEKSFHRLWHWIKNSARHWNKAFGAPAERVAERVELAELRPSLTLLARLLSGQAIEILTAEAEGGYRGSLFYLPASFSLGQTQAENRSFYLFRTAYLSVQSQLGLNWPEPGSYSLQASRQQAEAVSEQVLQRLWVEYPALQAVYACFCERLAQQEQTQTCWLWGHWMSPLAELGAQVKSPQQPAVASHPEAQTLMEAPAREDVEVLLEDREAIDRYNLQHYYEKVETLETFQGSWRQADGSDELKAHAEALQELDLRQVVRSDQPVHSVLQSEFLPGASAPESRDQVAKGYFISYDEWDERKKAYRPDFCRVYPSFSRGQDKNYWLQTLAQHRVTRLRLKQRFAQVFNQLEQVRRQVEGEELELDALVNFYAERQAGLSPDERLYLSRRKRRQEASILVLLDLSLSTDGYTGGERVLDVEKQAVLLFGELLDEYGDRFRVDGFSSRTRHHCDYVTFKDFTTPWAQAAARIGAAEPQGYTRIGPALRHATSVLSQESSRSRWILLLSDGKPNDYDRYEGQYGLADVRQAIREARREGIQIQALAIESRARHYLPLMLGEGAYRILPHPHQLPQALAQFYTRLARSSLI